MHALLTSLMLLVARGKTACGTNYEQPVSKANYTEAYARSTNQCKSAILPPFGLTTWFTSDLGTRQGAVLSPLLFSLLVNPLADLLKSQGFSVHLGDIHIACLLYADDLVLIADSEAQLRDMLETATQFFRQWRFTVSERKSQVVAFGPGETQSLRDRVWQLGGVTI
jgi:hypothetical protein